MEECYSSGNGTVEQSHTACRFAFRRSLTAYASVSRFRVDDIHPYIYGTHDGGKTWKLIANGIADDAAVNVVREDSVNKNLLFAGTENAVWVSFDAGTNWQSLQLNLPHTVKSRFVD